MLSYSVSRIYMMFSWETCEFFQAIEHRQAAASVFTLLLSCDNLLTGYEHYEQLKGL